MTPQDMDRNAIDCRVVYVAPRQTVLWVIAGFLAVIATVLVLRDPMLSMPTAQAQSGNGMVGARGLFAFTGPLDNNSMGLFMMDVDAGTVWCYQYHPVKGRMRLVAARSFRFDRYLENYNQDTPTPDEVSAMLDQRRQAANRAANLGGAPGDKVNELPDLNSTPNNANPIP